MIIWNQDGNSFVIIEQTQRIEIIQLEDAKYSVCADGFELGYTDTLENAVRVLEKIAVCFESAQVTCDPW